MGLKCQPDQFFLAGEAAVEFLAARYTTSRVLLLASDDIARVARKKLRVCSDMSEDISDVDWVLVCRDRTISFEKIEAAVNAIRQGAGVVVSNLDMTHPGQSGSVHTETGAIWMMLQSQFSGLVNPTVIGKPNPDLLLSAVKTMGLKPLDFVFLGDNLSTDAAAASSAGVPFIHTGGEGFCLADLICH